MFRREVTDLSLDQRCRLRLVVLLRPENGACERIPVNSKEFLADMLCEVGGREPCLVIEQQESVLFPTRAKGTVHPVDPVTARKGHGPSVCAAGPGPVSEPLVAVLASAVFTFKSVEHDLEKGSERRLAPSVLLKQDIEAVLKHIGEAGELTEVFNVTGKKFHIHSPFACQVVRNHQIGLKSITLRFT